ncbi:MAG: YqgE/AlgH family protein [Desulfobulbaceae bacterium]|nr:YqgE/AlgH family protein [Desulfobulbaceae bacterium]
MESLAGFFLIATPQMPDPRFAKKVIYICSHDAEGGAMGLVINEQIPDVTLEALYQGTDIPCPDGELPALYFGGPVDVGSVFILHSSDYEAQEVLKITNDIVLSRAPEILEDIAQKRGPRHYRFILGYSGWGPGQLEQELAMDGWLTLPGDYDDIFLIEPHNMWKKITMKHGIDISLFGEITGTA